MCVPIIVHNIIIIMLGHRAYRKCITGLGPADADAFVFEPKARFVPKSLTWDFFLWKKITTMVCMARTLTTQPQCNSTK